MVSSAYHFQHAVYCDNVDNTFFSNLTMKIPPKMGPNGAPIALSSLCKYSCPLKKNSKFFVQRIIS